MCPMVVQDPMKQHCPSASRENIGGDLWVTILSLTPQPTAPLLVGTCGSQYSPWHRGVTACSRGTSPLPAFSLLLFAKSSSSWPC